jgi:pyruvate dehydrogenase E2 component (dihydrolipoamide acetyltransferase)
LKEGDRFEAGTAICEVETDKATVTYDATEEGYIAKILVGTGEVKVGQPMMITVDEKEHVAAFADYKATASAAPVATPAPTPAPAHVAAAAAAPAPVAAPVAAAATSAAATGHRVVASPLARKLMRDAGMSASAAQGIVGTGPGGRIVSADVISAIAAGATSKAAAPVAAPAAGRAAAPAVVASGVPGVFQDFELSDLARAVADRQTAAKQSVPHYYLSVELNLTKLLRLREELNAASAPAKGAKGPADGGLSVLDFLVKASALAMKQVPDVNGAWMDSFVRRYEQVDVNLVMGTGAGLLTPVIRDAGALGLKAISKEIAQFEDSLFTDGQGADAALDATKLAVGTFSIHNLGMYGVKSAAPIVLTPQSCALALGAIVDTVVPAAAASPEDDNWAVAPVMVATLSCDHRVVDGAVGAQWLSALKTLVENPSSMLL